MYGRSSVPIFKKSFVHCKVSQLGFICDKQLFVIGKMVFFSISVRFMKKHLPFSSKEKIPQRMFLIAFLLLISTIIRFDQSIVLRRKFLNRQATFSYRGPFLCSVKDSRPSNAFVEKERFKTCTEVCCIFLFQQSNFSHSFRKMKFMCTFIRRKYNFLFVCIRLNLFLGIAYVTQLENTLLDRR